MTLWSLRPHADRAGAAALMVFGVFWVVAAARQTYFVDTPHVSLSFLPMAAGAILTLLSAVVVFGRSKPALPLDRVGDADTVEVSDDAVEVGEPNEHGGLRVGLALVALVIYALLLEHVHSLLTTFGLMVVALALAGEPLRPRLFLIAAVVALLLFAMFVIWLGVPLPGGRFT